MFFTESTVARVESMRSGGGLDFRKEWGAPVYQPTRRSTVSLSDTL